mmetsp:Transcript_34529/g.107251  ORF Transcript_34529/g.107251 Transcript_34529/m.107251 type:complete len:266 (-) Transcript_34529:405-1202(-)
MEHLVHEATHDFLLGAPEDRVEARVGVCHPREQRVGVRGGRRLHLALDKGHAHLRLPALREPQERGAAPRVVGRVGEVVVGLHEVPDPLCLAEPLRGRRPGLVRGEAVLCDDGALVGPRTCEDEVVRRVELRGLHHPHGRAEVGDCLEHLADDPGEVPAPGLVGRQVLQHRVVREPRVAVDAVGPGPHARVDAQTPGHRDEIGDGPAAPREDAFEHPPAGRHDAHLLCLLLHLHQVVVDVPAVDDRPVGHCGEQPGAPEARRVHC